MSKHIKGIDGCYIKNMNDMNIFIQTLRTESLGNKEKTELGNEGEKRIVEQRGKQNWATKRKPREAMGRYHFEAGLYELGGG